VVVLSADRKEVADAAAGFFADFGFLAPRLLRF
jgi:hypothetical protein